MSTFRFVTNDDGRIAIYIQPASLATLEVRHNAATLPIEVDAHCVQAIARVFVTEGDDLELITTSKKTGKIISHASLEVINSMEESGCYGFFISSQKNAKFVETWDEGDVFFFAEKPEELHLSISHEENSLQFNLDESPENHTLVAQVNGVERTFNLPVMSWDNVQDTDTVFISIRNERQEQVASLMFEVTAINNVCKVSNVQIEGRTGNLHVSFTDIANDGDFFDWCKFEESSPDDDVEVTFAESATEKPYYVMFYDKKSMYIVGANSENSALNCAMLDMLPENQAHNYGRVEVYEKGGRVIHQFGTKQLDFQQRPTITISTFDQDSFYVNFSSYYALQTSIFDGKELQQNERHTYRLQLKRGQKFILTCVYTTALGEELVTESTLHYVDGRAIIAPSGQIDVKATFYVQSHRGIVNMVYSPVIKTLEMHHSCFVCIPQNKQVDTYSMLLPEYEVYNSPDNALLAAKSDENIYRCFVPRIESELEDNKIVLYASKLFIVGLV